MLNRLLKWFKWIKHPSSPLFKDPCHHRPTPLTLTTLHITLQSDRWSFKFILNIVAVRRKTCVSTFKTWWHEFVGPLFPSRTFSEGIVSAIEPDRDRIEKHYGENDPRRIFQIVIFQNVSAKTQVDIHNGALKTHGWAGRPLCRSKSTNHSLLCF